jgi:hypothetical protein
MLSGCKTAQYTCTTDGYGQDEWLFYKTCYKFEAKIKQYRSQRLSNYQCKIYYNNDCYFVNFPCDIVEEKGFLGVPLFTVGDTVNILRDSENMHIYEMEVVE